MTTPPSHVLIIPCSVTGEPQKASRHLSKQTEDIPGSRPGEGQDQGAQAHRAPWWGPKDLCCGAEFCQEGLSLFPTPRNIISVSPFLKVRDPIPVIADLIRIRHMSKKQRSIFPNPLDDRLRLFQEPSLGGASEGEEL